MEREDKIQHLQKKLEELRRTNREAWDMYGSELCAGHMINEEEKLEKEIEELKDKQKEEQLQTLDEHHKQILELVQSMYKLIGTAEKALEIFRTSPAYCHHPIFEYVNYQWAPGHIVPNTKVCSVCGKILPNDEIKD